MKRSRTPAPASFPTLRALDGSGSHNLRWVLAGTLPATYHLREGDAVVAVLERHRQRSRSVTASDGWELVQHGLFRPRVEAVRLADGLPAAQIQHRSIWSAEGTVRFPEAEPINWERSKLGFWFRVPDGPALVSIVPELGLTEGIADVYPDGAGNPHRDLLLVLGWELLLLERSRGDAA